MAFTTGDHRLVYYVDGQEPMELVLKGVLTSYSARDAFPEWEFKAINVKDAGLEPRYLPKLTPYLTWEQTETFMRANFVPAVADQMFAGAKRDRDEIEMTVADDARLVEA